MQHNDKLRYIADEFHIDMNDAEQIIHKYQELDSKEKNLSKDCPDCGWPNNGHGKFQTKPKESNKATITSKPKEPNKATITLEDTLDEFIAFNQSPEAKDNQWFNIQARSYLYNLRMLRDEKRKKKLEVGDQTYFEFCGLVGTVVKVHDLGNSYSYDFAVTYKIKLDGIEVPVPMRLYNIASKHLLMTFKNE